MNCTSDKIKRICNFYISDLHFAVMLLPYINNELSNGTSIELFFEKSMQACMTVLLEKINIENRNKILELNWKKEEDTNNIDERIKQVLNKRGKKIFIINGNNNYINEVNNKIDKYLKFEKLCNNELRIIDCYKVEENEREMYKIIKMHDSILNTIGEQDIEKIV